MNKDTVTIGLDLSLTGTGMCVKQGSITVIDTIKTLPVDFPNDLSRIIHIRDTILGKIPLNTKMICIEDFFTGPNAGSAIRIAMLGTAVRMALYERKMSFIVCAPTSLKKYIMGKGVGEKSLILREVYKKYGLEVKDDNQADSVVLCHIGEHFYKILTGAQTDEVPKHQMEVVKKLIESKKERGFNLPQDDS